MHVSLAALVRERAGNTCEYCRLPQALSAIPFEIDHVIPQKHHGLTVESNLALACFYCNSFKGPNLAGIDPDSQSITRLFHPRQDVWSEHFQWQGPFLLGVTPIGRTTIDVPGINLPEFVALRESLIAEGSFSPA